MLNDSLPTRAATLVLAGEPLRLWDVRAVARDRKRPELADAPHVFARMNEAVAVVQRAVERGERVYGVTTGFGSMAEVMVPQRHATHSQQNLLAFLNAGAGAPLAREHTRAAMLLRANMLLRGHSGVRPEIVQRLVRLLAEDAVPVVRELGSIGASGDLIPLAVIARAISGQAGPCLVSWQGQEVEASQVLEALGYAPLDFLPKEALAIVNGTTFSSAIAANAAGAARGLLCVALAVNALMLRALAAHEDPFDPFVHAVKPHAGQVWTARAMRKLLGMDEPAAVAAAADHTQDRYSLRCLPQYWGPLVEIMARVEHVVDVEMNAVTDNPLIDDQGRFHQSGNFLGQYIGVAMDDLRRCLGLLAKHLDVQIALLVEPGFNQGLPASLQGNARLPYNMGLKGLQITGNSIAPLLAYYGNPLVEHYPTHAEQFNQNVNGLSWGSANLAWKSVELTRQYLSVALIFAVQAADLRARVQWGQADGRRLFTGPALDLYEAVYETLDRSPTAAAPLIHDDADQSLEEYLARLSANLGEEGSLLQAVAPISQMFGEARLGC